MSRDLDRIELSRKLDEILSKAKDKERRLIALQGEFPADEVQTTSVGAVRVVAVRSELELRRELPGIHDETAFTAYMLAWPARELPVDIAGRFVRHGRVFRFQRIDRIRSLFGGSRSYVDVDNDLARSRLGAYLVERFRAGDLDIPAGRVTLDSAFATWLTRQWGLDAGEALGLDTLVAWAARNGRGHAMRDELATDTGAKLRSELDAFLRRRVGDAGPLVLDSWLAGRGRLLLQFAALFEAMVEDPKGAPSGAIRSVARLSLQLDDANLDALVQPLGRGAGAAFRAVVQAEDPHFVSAVLADAEKLISSSEHAALAGSPRLPSAWRVRLDGLGAALTAGVESPSVETFAAARGALRQLEGHVAYLDEANVRTLRRAQFATRLLGWLVVRPDRRHQPGHQSYADAQSLAVWYAQEGGYVDLARRRARGGGDSTFETGIAAVLAAVDNARVKLDRRFAKAYVEWLHANRPKKPLLAIDQVVETFVAPYLKGGEHRRMLVLLMDGMAWAQAVELLDDLGRGSSPWYPLAWNTQAYSTGASFFTPVLAQLPSVTKVSRSAFFAGVPTKSGAKLTNIVDAKVWAKNKALEPLYPGGGFPKLLAKSDAFEIDGTARKPALTLIEDTSQPVVALIVNGIDDHLKASTQVDQDWTVDRIHALRDLLDSAARAGRAVLLAADHGHVSGQRLENAGRDAGPGEGSTRWRSWIEGDVEREFEVSIESDGYAWAPKGPKVKGVILLADDTRQYGGAHHYGEHGGASLAEVVAPTFVIGTEAIKPETTEHPDSALETRPALPPSWWLLDVEAAHQPATAKPQRKTPTQESLVKLWTEPGSAAPAPAESTSQPDGKRPHVSEATSKLLAKLAKLVLFKARAPDSTKRKATLQALELLLERNCSVPAAVFAKHVGLPGYRVGGFVSNLTEVLNIDGYEVVAYDPQAKLVILNDALLKQGFGL